MAHWRRATAADVAQIARISSIVLEGYPEEERIFEELVRLSPFGCHVLEEDGAVYGYVLSHAWRRADPPPLNTPIGALPQRPDSWYIHDLGLLDEIRGRGEAGRAVDIVASYAKQSGFDNISIVAVNGAAGFWKKQGFTPLMPEGMAARLTSYGADALYMERLL